jgi:hypothetical protein
MLFFVGYLAFRRNMFYITFCIGDAVYFLDVSNLLLKGYASFDYLFRRRYVFTEKDLNHELKRIQTDWKESLFEWRIAMSSPSLKIRNSDDILKGNFSFRYR